MEQGFGCGISISKMDYFHLYVIDDDDVDYVNCR